MMILQSLIILLLIGLTACNSVDKNAANTLAVDTTPKAQSESEHFPKTGELYKKTLQQIKEERQQEIADSINSVKTLKFALKIARSNRHKNEFNLGSDTLSIRFGYIFSTSVKHLIINRTFAYGFNTDIYKLHQDNFVKVCSKEMAMMAYIGDTIQDVNGDGRADFLFHWYPSSGCCLRDIYDVYLQKSNGDFAEEVEFINPNFSAKEKIIRGLCYGYGAPLYKYRWNRYKVDTIEYIYFPDSTNGNHFIRRKHEDEDEKGEIIRELPDEYKKIGYGRN